MAEQVLAYAAKRVSSDYDEDDIKNKLRDWQTLAGKTKKSVIRKAVQKILKLPRNQRKKLSEAVTNDIRFYEKLDDPDFEFLYRKLPEPTREAGNELLLRFYGILGSKTGFANLVGQKARLNGAILEELYRQANKTRMICPACLVERLPRATGGISQNDREHYFPQSKYPPLAVHPFNLAIACIKCNQRRHSDIDPISDHKAGALLDSFLPYIRPGLDQIELKFEPAVAKRPMVTISGKAGEVRAKRRAMNFDQMYKLSAYWSNYLEDIDQTLRDRVFSKSSTPTLADARKVLEDTVFLDERQKMSEPEAFLRGQYSAWILNERLTRWFGSIISK